MIFSFTPLELCLNIVDPNHTKLIWVIAMCITRVSLHGLLADHVNVQLQNLPIEATCAGICNGHCREKGGGVQ